MTSPTRLGALAFALALSASASAHGVRVVTPDPVIANLIFSSIGSAIAAADDGDVLLVASGTYSGFHITAKSVSIYAVPGADVRIVSPISMVALGSTQTVVLSGLRNDLPDNQISSMQALWIAGCVGQVRIERCSFKASDELFGNCPSSILSPGRPAVRIENSSRVCFQGCELVGGRGDSLNTGQDPMCAPGAIGGPGIVATVSTVALYDCVVTGGEGGSSHGTQGQGGYGLDLKTLSVVLASNSTVSGGQGGLNTLAQPGTQGGAGGVSVRFQGVTRLVELDSTFQGGPGGIGSGGAGPSGAAFEGGAPYVLAGTAREVTLTPSVQADLSSWAVTYQGVPGEHPVLLSSSSPGYKLSVVAHGTWLVQRAMLRAIDPLGMTDGAGSLGATLAIGDVPAGSLIDKRYVQTALGSMGQIWLGSPAAIVVLDRDSGPDCNGNGVSDLVEVLLGTVPDTNHNLRPDSCPGG